MPIRESRGFCEVLETHDRWVPGFGDLIEAGLNEGAAGFVGGDYGDCIFARWWMPSLGVVVNGA